MKPNFLLIDSRGTRQACREHGVAFTGKRCPKCEADKLREQRYRDMVSQAAADVQGKRQKYS